MVTGERQCCQKNYPQRYQLPWTQNQEARAANSKLMMNNKDKTLRIHVTIFFVTNTESSNCCLWSKILAFKFSSPQLTNFTCSQPSIIFYFMILMSKNNSVTALDEM